ncbi:hypothetical protein BDZ91DRAFT_730021 [Kalaharituber pfeilii]|nr:hypothetical protein BDZ91DRAFT_730021 [Kalaharituber pfeilii]
MARVYYKRERSQHLLNYRRAGFLPFLSQRGLLPQPANSGDLSHFLIRCLQPLSDLP